MKQVLIEMDDDIASRLERVAPGRSRKRSEFVRMAIRRALWELEEEAVAGAHREHPDSAADSYVDERAWEPKPVRGRARK